MVDPLLKGETIMRTSIILTAACVTGLCVTAALAQGGSMAGPSAAPARTNFCGTVAKGVEANCLVVKNSMPVATYNISSANPKPTAGRMITGSGVAGGASTCMQGTVLTDVQWKPAAACPGAK
jgi:hypothetical protein